MNLFRDKMRTSGKQFELLVSYMETLGGDLNKSVGLGLSKSHTLQTWDEISLLLNAQCSDGYGKPKSVEKWRKVWSDLKNNTKKKAARIHRAATNEGPPSACKLNTLELRVLKIIGADVVFTLDEDDSTVDTDKQPELSMEHGYEVPAEFVEPAESEDDIDVKNTEIIVKKTDIDTEEDPFEALSPQMSPDNSNDVVATNFCSVPTQNNTAKTAPNDSSAASTKRPSKINTVSINKLRKKPANKNSVEHDSDLNKSSNKTVPNDSKAQSPKLFKINAVTSGQSPQYFKINTINDSNGVSTSQPNIKTVSFDKLRMIPMGTLKPIDLGPPDSNTTINMLNSKQIDQLDECELYCALLAKKLKSLPDLDRQELMYEIDGLVMKRRKYRPIPAKYKP